MMDSSERGGEVTFGDLTSMVWRQRWVIIALCVVASVGTYGVSRLLPKWYESTATVVTPKEGSGGVLGGLLASGMLQQNPGVAMPTLPSFTPNRDLLVGVLKSRTIAQAIVERFGLQARYRASYPDDAVKQLRDLTTIATSREGVISVKVEDRDPATAAAIANYYIERLPGSADCALRNRRGLAPAHVPDRPARAGSPRRPGCFRAVAAPVSGAEPRDRAARPDQGRDRGRGEAEGRDHGRCRADGTIIASEK